MLPHCGIKIATMVTLMSNNKLMSNNRTYMHVWGAWDKNSRVLLITNYIFVAI